MAVNDIWQIRFFSTYNSQVAINVLHYKVTATTGTPPTATQVATLFVATFPTAIKALMGASARYEGVGAQQIFPLPVLAEAFVTTNAGFGAQDTDMLPTQTCGIITKRTAIAGPGGRGRVYVPFPAEEDNDVISQPVGDYVTRLQNLGNLMDDNIVYTSGGDGTTLTPVILRRTDYVTTTILSTKARTIWGTQRRRGSYGAFNKLPF